MPVGHIRQAAEFEQILAVAPRSRSTHFAAHHLAARAAIGAAVPQEPARHELSTDCEPQRLHTVDNMSSEWLLGCVLPKRHARRAVTRNLVRRQIRAALERDHPTLAPGLWVIRLKAPFDRKLFHSASSDALRTAVRDELALLLRRAAKK
jgi:ribonuclease P protein component